MGSDVKACMGSSAATIDRISVINFPDVLFFQLQVARAVIYSASDFFLTRQNSVRKIATRSLYKSKIDS